MTIIIAVFIVSICFVFNKPNAADITLHTNDATVWLPEQAISGQLSGFTADEVIVHHNEITFPVRVHEGRNFSFKLLLKDSSNSIWVEAPAGNIISDTIHYRLGYNPMPVVKPVAMVNYDTVTLTATTVENPYGMPFRYLWVADSLNPAPCKIINPEDSIATVKIPSSPGKYSFRLLIVADQDSGWYRTFVRRDEHDVEVFEMGSDYPEWMDEAIIYEITPYSFVENGDFEAITAKLPEIKRLGVNTIWLQPVYKSFHGGQGYDVTDYLSVNPDFGTKKDLHGLIEKAHALGLRVLFDMILNHTSINHPYAQDRIRYGEASRYFDFYQHTLDDKPYSSFYNKDEHGFVTYFWEDLVNLNYSNEEVQRWMLEVCKYWVREFNIDGYRFDAIWGVNARMPSFAGRLRTALKSIKPEVLMLAEDKGSDPDVFTLGFDAAYDWTSDTSWVSQWSWEYDYVPGEQHTIFNFPDSKERGEMLYEALFEGCNAERKLYYMENNDLARFISEYKFRQTKMAAALIFSLPGIPMLYNGQEIGFRQHPYSTNAIFKREKSIRVLDSVGISQYYEKLIRLHKKHNALSKGFMQEIPQPENGAVTAFHRFSGSEDIVVVVNMDSIAAEIKLDLEGLTPEGTPSRRFRLKDILTDEVFKLGQEPEEVRIPMKPWSVRWLKLGHRSAEFLRR